MGGGGDFAVAKFVLWASSGVILAFPPSVGGPIICHCSWVGLSSCNDAFLIGPPAILIPISFLGAVTPDAPAILRYFPISSSTCHHLASLTNASQSPQSKPGVTWVISHSLFAEYVEFDIRFSPISLEFPAIIHKIEFAHRFI